MTKHVSFGWTLAFVLFFQAIQAQNAVVGTGFSTGWGGGSCPTGSGNFKYLGASIAGTFILTTAANGTGNQFFRMGIDWSGTTAQRAITLGSDVAVTPGTKYTLNSNCTTSGAMSYNVASTSYNYVFKTLNAGTNPTGTFVFFEVQGAVREVSSVAQSPVASGVNQSIPVTVTATLDGAFSTGQAVYLRYTTNNFASSTVVKMTGSGSTYTATIPGQTMGTEVRYYTFTSGDVSSIAPADADLYSINLNNNSGSNYSYTVLGPLPVELTRFSARAEGSAVQLSWETATERNNERFEVQRSADTEQWQLLGNVDSKGSNSIRPLQYGFADESPLPGSSYYRLRQVDLDGRSTLSAIVKVLRPGKSDFSVYPNPLTGDTPLQIETGALEGPTQLRLFDQQGRLVREWALELEGQRSLPLELGELPAGTYFLRLGERPGVVLVKQ
jgi:hypothetical protein